MSLTERLPSTLNRVSEHTAEHVNRRIHDDTEDSLTFFAYHPEQIRRRLDELDREWDMERLLEANAATLSLAGLTLGLAHDRRWLALPIMVSAFLLQHAIQGWCPPVAVFRRRGVRTATEIAAERYALKYLRGDFGNDTDLTGSARERARKALAAALG